LRCFLWTALLVRRGMDNLGSGSDTVEVLRRSSALWVVPFRLLGRDCSGNAFSGPITGMLARYGMGLLLVSVGVLASVFVVTSGSAFSGTTAGFCF
jgi:hypothetical protein